MLHQETFVGLDLEIGKLAQPDVSRIASRKGVTEGEIANACEACQENPERRNRQDCGRVRHSALCGGIADESQLRDFALSPSLTNHTPIYPSFAVDGPSNRERLQARSDGH